MQSSIFKPAIDITQIEKQTNVAIKRLTDEYAQHPEGVKTSFRELCSQWRWAKRSDVFTHSIHPYPAKVLPYIPIFFLSTEKYARKDETIMDVFSGSSTVLLESITHPLFPRNAYGIEINPLARLIGKVKTTLVEPKAVSETAKRVLSKINSETTEKIPEYDNLDFWFLPRMKHELGKIAEAIEAEPEGDIKDFLLVCFSALIRPCSNADPDISVPVKLVVKSIKEDWTTEKKEKVRKRNTVVTELLIKLDNTDPIALFNKIIKQNIVRMQSFWEVMQDKMSRAYIIGDDARDLQRMKMEPRAKMIADSAHPLEDGSVSMIITSPPYGMAQKYVRATRLEMLWLGLLKSDEIANLDKNTVGTERSNAGDDNLSIPFGIPILDNLITTINKTSEERAGLTVKYFRDMIKVLTEVKRVLKTGGTLVMIIGDNSVEDLNVPNHEILTIMCEKLGFNRELILRDPVRSRGMITKRHKTAGMIEDDWILVLRKQNNSNKSNCLESTNVSSRK